jgi:hypothetical protein
MTTLRGWAVAIAGLLLSAATAQADPPPAEVFFGGLDMGEAALSCSCWTSRRAAR